jgi:hypothetical protein
MAVANSREIDGRIAVLYHCMANLTVYLLKVANLRITRPPFVVLWETAKYVRYSDLTRHMVATLHMGAGEPGAAAGLQPPRGFESHPPHLQPPVDQGREGW